MQLLLRWNKRRHGGWLVVKVKVKFEIGDKNFLEYFFWAPEAEKVFILCLTKTGLQVKGSHTRLFIVSVDKLFGLLEDPHSQ